MSDDIKALAAQFDELKAELAKKDEAITLANKERDGFADRLSLAETQANESVKAMAEMREQVAIDGLLRDGKITKDEEEPAREAFQLAQANPESRLWATYADREIGHHFYQTRCRRRAHGGNASAARGGITRSCFFKIFAKR